MVHTRCPHCNSVIRADLGQRGRLVVCPSCERKFTCEALPWWETFFRRTAKHEGRKAKKAHAEPYRPVRSGHAPRPYERVDESVLQEIAAQRRSRLPALVVAGALLLICGIVLVLWTFPLSTRPKDVTPPPDAGQPPVGTGPETSEQKPVPRQTEEAIFAAPDYAYPIEAAVRTAGYTPRKGAKWPGREAYYFNVREHPRVAFAAFPAGGRVLLWAMIAPAVPEPEGEEPVLERNCILNVLRRWLLDTQRDELAAWLGERIEGCLRAAAARGNFVAERRFGEYVLRVETFEHPTQQAGARVELARAYRPIAEVEGTAPIAAWSDMRTGATLEEVERFAGHGDRVSSSGSGEWMVERFVWPGNAEVIFRNGRAITWKAPSE